MLPRRFYTLLLLTSVALLSTGSYAASIYNSDPKPHKIQIKPKEGEAYYVTVYSRSSHLFDCSSGCQVKVLDTGYTKTLTPDATALIDDGKLRVG